jgi:hypothetical protein
VHLEGNCSSSTARSWSAFPIWEWPCPKSTYSGACGPLSPTLCGERKVVVDTWSRDLIRTYRTILYPKLEDHDTVRHYPPVQGVYKDVLFFSHDNAENAETDSVSKYNMFEVGRAWGSATIA